MDTLPSPPQNPSAKHRDERGKKAMWISTIWTKISFEAIEKGYLAADQLIDSGPFRGQIHTEDGKYQYLHQEIVNRSHQVEGTHTMLMPNLIKRDGKLQIEWKSASQLLEVQRPSSPEDYDMCDTRPNSPDAQDEDDIFDDSSDDILCDKTSENSAWLSDENEAVLDPQLSSTTTTVRDSSLPERGQPCRVSEIEPTTTLDPKVSSNLSLQPQAVRTQLDRIKETIAQGLSKRMHQPDGSWRDRLSHHTRLHSCGRMICEFPRKMLFSLPISLVTLDGEQVAFLSSTSMYDYTSNIKRICTGLGEHFSRDLRPMTIERVRDLVADGMEQSATRQPAAAPNLSGSWDAPIAATLQNIQRLTTQRMLTRQRDGSWRDQASHLTRIESCKQLLDVLGSAIPSPQWHVMHAEGMAFVDSPSQSHYRSKITAIGARLLQHLQNARHVTPDSVLEVIQATFPTPSPAQPKAASSLEADKCKQQEQTLCAVQEEVQTSDKSQKERTHNTAVEANEKDALKRDPLDHNTATGRHYDKMARVSAFLQRDQNIDMGKHIARPAGYPRSLWSFCNPAEVAEAVSVAETKQPIPETRVPSQATVRRAPTQRYGGPRLGGPARAGVPIVLSPRLLRLGEDALRRREGSTDTSGADEGETKEE